MKTSPQRNRVPRAGLICCYLSAIFAPLGWLYFTLLTRNTFRLNELVGGDLILCVVCALIPAFCNCFVWFVQRGGPVLRGWLLACSGFVVAAAGWLITLATQWNVWDAAYSTGVIEKTQQGMLRAVSLIGLVAALVPLIPVVIRVVRSQKES